MSATPSLQTTFGAIALALVLTLAGCSGMSPNSVMNPTSNPTTNKQIAGLGVGTLLGAGGGALVGAAIAGAPGLGAGVGALIGAGAGWAVAAASENQQVSLASTQAKLEQEQQEIDQTRAQLNDTRHQLNEQTENETRNENPNNTGAAANDMSPANNNPNR
jgi:proteasome assembly chaperone (PAC2) family protein